MNDSTRLAALPELPTAVRKSPRSFFSCHWRVEGRALHLPHADADADGVQVVQRGLGHRREARDRREVAGVEAVRIAGLGEELLGLLRVVGVRRHLEREVHHARHDDAGGRTEAQACRLVGRLAVEGVVHRLAQALVVPRRLRIPLIGELDPEDRGVARGQERVARVALERLRLRAVQEEGVVRLAAPEHGQARGAVGHALHGQLLDVRRVPPVRRCMASNTISRPGRWLTNR